MRPESVDYARAKDQSDPLARYRSLFVGAGDAGVAAYLDGNSLGRPLKATVERMSRFIEQEWGGRLIRAWDEGWLELPAQIGDELGRVMLGAAPGQTTIGDSTTVLLYKLCRAAVAARPERSEIVLDRDNFPTDRFVLEGIAAECGLTLRWVSCAFDGGVTVQDLAPAVGPETALVVLSHVAYRSGHLADVAGITDLVHDAGALVLWDLCHSAGSVRTELDKCRVDLAVGCTYKYLNGGPGSPAFAYVRSDLQATLRQPIQGWLGSSDPFGMGEHYAAAAGIRGFTSGTPPILAMQPMRDMIELIDKAGMEAVRAKSVALTEYAVELYDVVLAPLGVKLSSPRDPLQRGGHITVDHPSFRLVTAKLWERGVIPDYRNPSGIRLGLSPLSTSFEEVRTGVLAVAEEASRS